MRIEPCNDLDLVKKVLTHPEIYPYISDDGSPNPDDFEPIHVEGAAFHLGVWSDDNRLLGIFFIHKNNAILWEIHTSLLPICRGRCAREAARLVIEWIFGNTSCRKLMSWVPSIYPHVIEYATNAGLVQEGVSKASFLKNGQVCDMILFGIRSPESCHKRQQ